MQNVLSQIGTQEIGLCMSDISDLIKRLRDSALDEDNFPRMWHERGASVRDCLDAADRIEVLVASDKKLYEAVKNIAEHHSRVCVCVFCESFKSYKGPKS